MNCSLITKYLQSQMYGISTVQKKMTASEQYQISHFYFVKQYVHLRTFEAQGLNIPDGRTKSFFTTVVDGNIFKNLFATVS